MYNAIDRPLILAVSHYRAAPTPSLQFEEPVSIREHPSQSPTYPGSDLKLQCPFNSIMPTSESNSEHALAPGTSSFIQLAESHIFVDKTYAIIEFLQAGVQPVHLVLRGRRSGKTTLLRSFQ
jgi:hypothetical protein